MATYTYTHRKTGQIITIYARDARHACLQLEARRRDALNRTLPDGLQVNTIEYFPRKDGTWIEAELTANGRNVLTGRCIVLQYTKYRPSVRLGGEGVEKTTRNSILPVEARDF